MNLFEQNISLMQDPRYCILKDYLQNRKWEQDERFLTESIQCETTMVEDKKVLYAVKDEKTYQLDTLYRTWEAIDLWYDGMTSLGYNTKCIFCGLGNGMYVQKLLADADQTVQIMIYEPSIRIFIKAIHEFDLTDILSSKRCTLIVRDLYPMDVSDFLYHFITYYDIKNSIYQAYPNYSNLFPKEVKDFDNIIQSLLTGVRATQSVLARYGKADAINSLNNYRKFRDSKSLTDFYTRISKEIPVIIVASGPSLDKNIMELKNAVGKCLLIGVDSAMPALLAKDIIPDLFVTVDSMKSKKHVSDARIRQIPCVCELESRYDIVAKQEAPCFFINDLNPYINKFLHSQKIDVPTFSSGGSVANTACAIMTSMGFTDIIVVGQDLAYTDNKTHASNTVRAGSVKNEHAENMEYVDGYYGDKVLSSTEFILYRNWFEEEIGKNPDIHFYNATEGGAQIKGMENVSLKDIIARLCITDTKISEVIDDTANLFGEAEKSEFENFFFNIPELLQEMQSEIKKGMNEYQKMLELTVKGKAASGQMKKLVASTGELTRKIEKEPVMYYIFCMAQEKIQAMSEDIYDKYESENQEIIEGIQKGLQYLEILNNNINWILNYSGGDTDNNFKILTSLLDR